MTKYFKILKLSELSNEIRENVYNKLIDGTYTASIDIFTKHKNYYDVDVKIAGDNYHESDLCISHFGYNFYARTTRAIKGTRYKTFGHCINALRKLIEKMFADIRNISVLRIYYGYPSFDSQPIFGIAI